MIYKVKPMLIDGRKQEPPDNDFLLLPSLIYGKANDTPIGSARGLGIGFGYWIIGFAIYYLFEESK